MKKIIIFSIIMGIIIIGFVTASFIPDPFGELTYIDCNGAFCYLGLQTVSLPASLLDSLSWVSNWWIIEHEGEQDGVYHNYTLLELDINSMSEEDMGLATNFYQDAPSLTMMYKANELRSEWKQYAPLCVRQHDNSGMCEIVAYNNDVYCVETEFCQ